MFLLMGYSNTANDSKTGEDITLWTGKNLLNSIFLCCSDSKAQEMILKVLQDKLQVVANWFSSSQVSYPLNIIQFVELSDKEMEV